MSRGRGFVLFSVPEFPGVGVEVKVEAKVKENYDGKNKWLLGAGRKNGRVGKR